MSDIIWALWGAIQHKISQLDLDFWDYDVGRWERALWGCWIQMNFPDGWKMPE
jgi:hypothetical protein